MLDEAREATTQLTQKILPVLPQPLQTPFVIALEGEDANALKTCWQKAVQVDV